MKRIAITFVAVVMAAIGAQAQVDYMKVKKTDKSVLEIPIKEVEDISYVQKLTVKVKNNITITMIKVYGGTFKMGESADDKDVTPIHDVTLSDYFIAETEVTQELWEAVMGSNPSYYKGAKHPVEMVSWNECQEFIAKLNQLTNRNFRLPTEAEWEFAAKGGKQSRGYIYSGSDTLDDVAWNHSNSGNSSTGRSPHDVATRQPNELGLYDMSGNVWEWCQDRSGDYSSEPQTNPTGPLSGSIRVIRGGSFDSSFPQYHTVSRYSRSQSSKSGVQGLRLAL